MGQAAEPSVPLSSSGRRREAKGRDAHGLPAASHLPLSGACATHTLTAGQNGAPGVRPTPCLPGPEGPASWLGVGARRCAADSPSPPEPEAWGALPSERGWRGPAARPAWEKPEVQPAVSGQPEDLPACAVRTTAWGRATPPAGLTSPPPLLQACTHTVCVWAAQSCPTLRPHRQQPTRLLCPWDSLGKNTGVGYYFLLQGTFPTQGAEPVSCAADGFVWATGKPPCSYVAPTGPGFAVTELDQTWAAWERWGESGREEAALRAGNGRPKNRWGPVFRHAPVCRGSLISTRRKDWILGRGFLKKGKLEWTWSWGEGVRGKAMKDLLARITYRK